MIDPAVERQYSDCKELIVLWRTFHDFFVMGIKSENINPEKENQFLEIKSRIAMLHDSFMDALTHDQNIGQEVLNIVSRAITLKHLSRQSTADIKKMEIEWHESYLLLNETIGTLEEKRNELAQVNEAQYRAGKAAGAARQKFTHFFTSTGFKFTVVVVAVLFVTLGVQFLGIYDYNDLGKIPALKTPFGMYKTVYRKFINEDSPWPSIESMYRLPWESWPAGIKKPEVKPEDKSIIIAKIPSVVREKFAKATQYQREETRKENEGTVEIHTFLFPDASDAKAIENEWDKYNEDKSHPAPEKKMAYIRDVNAITVLSGGQGGFLDTVRLLVYMKK